jgi:hypothetical protein
VRSPTAHLSLLLRSVVDVTKVVCFINSGKIVVVDVDYNRNKPFQAG